VNLASVRLKLHGIKVMKRVSDLVEAEGKPAAAAPAAEGAHSANPPPKAGSPSAEPAAEESAEESAQAPISSQEREVISTEIETVHGEPGAEGEKGSESLASSPADIREGEHSPIREGEHSLTREGEHSLAAITDQPPAYYPTAKIVQDLLTFLNKKNIDYGFPDGAPMHDPCAVLYSIYPDVFESTVTHVVQYSK
jgi:hypothetical protein